MDNSFNVFLIVLFVFVLFFSFVFVIRQRHQEETREKNKPQNKANDSSKTRNRNGEPSEFSQWFSNRIEQFSKDMLAYHVFQVALEKRMPQKFIDELLAQYGLVSLIPLFSGYLAGFIENGLNSRDLEKQGTQWLTMHGVETSVEQWEKQMEQYWSRVQKEKAEQIVNDFLSSKSEK